MHRLEVVGSDASVLLIGRQGFLLWGKVSDGVGYGGFADVGHCPILGEMLEKVGSGFVKCFAEIHLPRWKFPLLRILIFED